MRDVTSWGRENRMEDVIPAPKDLSQIAKDLCEKALKDAKSQLHPLLQNTGLDRLEQREEFLQAFKSALEQRIARKLATWQPSVQAVFKYEETRTETMENWDGSIHLLVKVPRLSDAVRDLGRKLDRSLVNHLRQLPWRRFQMCQSILAVHQVTPRELRHGVGYGAMFCAVYTVPVQVWPQDRRSK